MDSYRDDLTVLESMRRRCLEGVIRSDLARKFGKAEYAKEIEAELAEGLGALRRNYKGYVDEEVRLAQEKMNMCASESETAARLLKEWEGRCEQSVMMREKLELELRCQRDVYNREIDILKQSEANLRRVIDKLQTEAQQSATELFELRVRLLFNIVLL